MKYKLTRGLLSVIFISCLFTYSGCVDECELDSEPTVFIYFSTQKYYRSVYGLHGKEKPDNQSADYQYSVPLSIKDDSTIVIFESDVRNDTLTIHYSRTVEMQSARCGFRIYFDDFEIVKPTTFTQASVSSTLDYSQDLYVNINE